MSIQRWDVRAAGVHPPMKRIALTLPIDETVLAYFWQRVDKRGPDECWDWTGSRRNEGQYGQPGYGRGYVGGHLFAAHRLSYIIHNGEFDESLFVCHACDRPSCVNPAHLFTGDNALNVRDRTDKGRGHCQKKTHCPHGHPYDEANTLICSDGQRKCRECERARCRRNYWRKKEAC